MFILNIVILFVVLAFLYYLQKKYVSFNKRVFSGLFLGGLLGIFMETR